MPSRLDYLIRKLDDLEDAIRREKREYDKARDRYDKMRRSEILDDLREQFQGYRTEHDQLRRARSSREDCLLPSCTLLIQCQEQFCFQTGSAVTNLVELCPAHPNQPPRQQQRHAHSHAAPPPNTQRSQQQAPPPPQHRTTYPHRPAPPQHQPSCPPHNSYGRNANAAGQTRGQPGNSSSRSQRPAPPRPHQKTEIVDFEIEEPDGTSYFVRGGAVVRDFDPARDKLRRKE